MDAHNGNITRAGCACSKLRCSSEKKPSLQTFKRGNLSYHDATAMPASATGNDQAQSPSKATAAAATTQPMKKPIRRWRDLFNRSVAPSINGCVRDSVSSSDSTVLVKLPVMTAVEGAPGTAKRKRAN